LLGTYNNFNIDAMSVGFLVDTWTIDIFCPI
jgi:hypothetical protein